jgi:hypothetical protein
LPLSIFPVTQTLLLTPYNFFIKEFVRNLRILDGAG